MTAGGELQWHWRSRFKGQLWRLPASGIKAHRRTGLNCPGLWAVYNKVRHPLVSAVFEPMEKSMAHTQTQRETDWVLYI